MVQRPQDLTGIGITTEKVAEPRARLTETGFSGPFPLDKFLIEVLVDSTGVYALVDRSRLTGDLVVIYVGRGQLKRRLIAHAIAGRAQLFVVRRVQSTVATFQSDRHGDASRTD
jgi:hypothetical protein